MKNKKSLIFLMVCSSLCGCYDIMTNHQLSITNRSKQKISVLYSNFADKILTENNVAYYTADWNVIKPDSSGDIIQIGGKDAWHNYIAKNETRKLFIYIFSTDTLKKYGGFFSMADIISQHKYLKLLTYSEKDLNKISWQITFK
jgi:hypothetical protein